MKKLIVACIGLSSFVGTTYAQSKAVSIASPDKSIIVTTQTGAGGQASYSIQYKGSQVLESSALGVTRADADFSKALMVTSVSLISSVKENYRLITGKRQNNTYTANKQTIHYKNAAGALVDIIWQVSNDGVAFRYYFPDKATTPKTIESEQTSFHLPATAKGWLQPMSIAKTGWEQVNPCYEEYYERGIAAGAPSPLHQGWVFPALFQSAGHWLLLTEAAMDGTYCGAKLHNDSLETNYHIAFPDPREVFTGQGLKPQSSLPWYSPWRIITIGSLATVIESTLGTSLAKAVSPTTDFSFVKPGKAAWSWALLKDDSTIFRVQKRFIDYAADMNWQYCLIDADWDTKIGYDSAQLLVNYAKQKKVGIWLWYNSAGAWNTTPYHPRNKLLTHEDREKEFARLEKMGVAGTKIDFFGGDGSSMIQYYLDILKDATAHHLMVNFHGATLPRGWQRTWPNLMSAEGVRGFENVTFSQREADQQATQCAMLPFARNAFDPMDYTPMCLYKVPRIKRQTTSAFELALPVIFLSGVQHLVEIPEGMAHMPAYVKTFLQQLPTAWDETKFIDGFPGDFLVVARRSGNKWYVAGINATTQDKQVTVDLSQFKGKKVQYVKQGSGDEFFEQKSLPATGKTTLTMGARDGFVLVVE